jgi:1-aminocyclopropane-1-carboxylate deaminase/D-cysteine desulfhydrase-like pyridoxal-dependent ACC family enzyme
MSEHEPRQHDDGVSCACGRPWPCSRWLTPVEQLAPELWVKREDEFSVAGQCGGKVRTCLELARRAQAAGAEVLVTAGSRHSPQVAIVAAVARRLGLEAHLHVPAGPLTSSTIYAGATGAELHQHRPGHNSVIIARARSDAEELGERGFLVPFGMEHPLAVDLTAGQVANLPAAVRRIVVAVGSAMSLAGILTGLDERELSVPVLGVCVGADPSERLARWAPFAWQLRTYLRRSPWRYEEQLEQPPWPEWLEEPPALRLDPVYEAKAVPFLEAGDLLWVVGRRA